ncbi:MAG TPA: 4-alpha-glucanotransferase [Planktothrix sp.]|jgi:4-alpha-glucanotransferase
MRIDSKQKLAGLLVPVFSLRHDKDFGIGDTTAMIDAIDFCAQTNMGILQILPINETGGDNSPYSAISSVALDPLYLTLAPNTVPGLTDQMIAEAAPNPVLEELRRGPVKYPRVREVKIQLLWSAFNAFEKNDTANDTDLSSQWQKFEQENKRWLEPYTLFRTLMDHHNGSSVWTQWEENVQNYGDALKTVKAAPNAKEIERSRRFWSYVQWLGFKQWKNVKHHAETRSVKLMGDLPFAVGRYSADVWSERKLFDLDWSCGSPPETYFQGDKFVSEWGQNWGMPLYQWKAHKEENYAWWRQRVFHLTELFHYFRIDHVLGFFRVYAFPWIPERNGEFVNLTKEEAKKITLGKLPHFIPRSDELPKDAESNAKEGTELLKVLMDAAGDTGIVAEDLGMVPDYVRPLIHKLGMAGFAIPIFERVEEDRSFKPKETLAPLSLATYGTHDHEPIATYYNRLVEWWHGADGSEGWKEIQRLMNFLGLDENNPPEKFTDALHMVFLKVLLETPCWVAVVMITDLLGTTQRFNEPGLSGDENWSQRLDRPLQRYLDDSAYGPKIREFARLIKETQRAPLVSARS